MKKTLASLFSIFLAFSGLIGCVGEEVEAESLPFFQSSVPSQMMDRHIRETQ